MLSFQQIERILGHALPASAHKHAAFWANTSSYSWAWRDAGREVSRRGLMPEQINFRLSHPMSDVLSPTVEKPPLYSVPAAGTKSVEIEAAEGAGSAQDADVLLLGCVKLKAGTPQQAKDLYVSDLFAKRRGYAEQRALPWFVLTAEHGLLHPDDVVAPYDVELKAQPESYRRAWGAWVIERLRGELGELAGVRLEVHAGDAYAEALVEPASAAGARLIRPLQGLRQGEQLAWYLTQAGLPLSSNSPPTAETGPEVRTACVPSSENADVFVASLRDVTLAIQLAQLDELHVPKHRRSKRGVLAAAPLPASTGVIEGPREVKSIGHWSLNVTDKDIENGQIRITREAKRDLLLMNPADLEVRLRGGSFRCTYDPRFGSDNERSGLLRLGKANLTRVLGEAVVLTAVRGVDGVLELE